jgi:hypothetical protein
MQEEQTVSFQPMSHDGPVPWFENLFVIYLLCVLLMTVVRAIRLMWTLRKHRKAQKREALAESSSQSFWEACHSTIRSIRDFSRLTFLLAALVLSWDATEIFEGVSNAKAPSFPYIAGELARALVPFVMGVGICSAQFCCSMFLDRLIRLRKPMVDCKPQPPGE